MLTVKEGTPAHDAGWLPGTEIISVNGTPAYQRLKELPLTYATGVREIQLAIKCQNFFSFPPDQPVRIEYRLPGEERIRTVTLVPGDYEDGRQYPYTSVPPIDLELRDQFVILKWSDFVTYVKAKVAVLEEAIGLAKSNNSAGMVIDLRGNGGGFVELYETMASYFFTAEEPMRKNINDEFIYDPAKGRPVNIFTTKYYLSAPKPDLAFTGPLIVLIDQGCQSSCEYFADHLQRLGRATIIGQYPSVGAGGSVTRVVLPGGLGFNYTWGKTVKKGTDIPNLEAKGVRPDIRVPVTLETELSKLEGKDPVMEKALAFLTRVSDPKVRLATNGWKWVLELSSKDRIEKNIDQPDSYTLHFLEDGTLRVKADCNLAKGTYTVGENNTISIKIGPATLALCPEGSRGDEFLKMLNGVIGFSFQEGKMALVSSADKVSVVLVFDPMEE